MRKVITVLFAAFYPAQKLLAKTFAQVRNAHSVGRSNAAFYDKFSISMRSFNFNLGGSRNRFFCRPFAPCFKRFETKRFPSALA